MSLLQMIKTSFVNLEAYLTLDMKVFSTGVQGDTFSLSNKMPKDDYNKALLSCGADTFFLSYVKIKALIKFPLFSSLVNFPDFTQEELHNILHDEVTPGLIFYNVVEM